MPRRGFSLIEAMVVVAVAGIVASFAVSSLTPVVRRAELGAATDRVVGFVARARMQAFIDRRCTQVLVLDKQAGRQQRLLLRELNTFDCDGVTAGHRPMETAPRIEADGPLWIEVDRTVLDDPRTRAELLAPASLVDTEGADCPAEMSACRELRFRPNGRVWSPDADLTNDDVTVRIVHESTGEEQRFVVGGNGAFKTLPGGY